MSVTDSLAAKQIIYDVFILPYLVGNGVSQPHLLTSDAELDKCLQTDSNKLGFAGISLPWVVSQIVAEP